MGPLRHDLRDRAASSSQVEHAYIRASAPTDTRVEMRSQPPHPSKPAIDASEVREALLDVLRCAIPPIKPLLAIDACRQPPALLHCDACAPLHCPQAVGQIQPLPLLSDAHATLFLCFTYSPVLHDMSAPLLALQLTSPFLQVKGGDLKGHIQQVRIGRAWFNVHTANTQELGGSFDVVDIACQLLQRDALKPHLH
jgi:hypothetical protein